MSYTNPPEPILVTTQPDKLVRCVGEHEWISGDHGYQFCTVCGVSKATFVICPQCRHKTDKLYFVSPLMVWVGCFTCFCKVADRVEDAARMASAVTKLQQEVAEIFEEAESTKEEGDPSE